jgi:hypothetical protein
MPSAPRVSPAAAIEVSTIEQSPHPGVLERGHIDAAKGSHSGIELWVAGWVIGKQAGVVAVEFVCGDRTVRATNLDRPRPDLAAAYPEFADAVRSGFATHVDVRLLPLEFELRVVALLDDGTRAPFGSIHARRVPQSDPATPPTRPAEQPGPTLKPKLEKLITHSVNSRSAADSGNGIGDTWGSNSSSLGPSNQSSILERLDFEGRTVLDLGCGLGHRSRRARALGATLVDGFERDADRIRAARLLNAYHDVTRVSFYNRDIGNPEAYLDAYDIVLALPVATALEGVMKTLAQITGEVFVTELPGSGLEDSTVLASIDRAFGSHEIAASESGDRSYVIAHSGPEAARLA